ncbi:hypothetical protein [Clostridium sp. AM58-1XD]|uniref:sodium:solute symporter family transporter n=1 Tax=Clostridium sp. AM58-1XD TaxID=2292307 RepID=UPI000E4756B1|nr:hypothetical protein [Clostridium sp. AM58-1XD]RGY97602.1 hypothetical protein DXA13_13885 [Clostridium sp. AM58-1XD]
MNIISGKIKMIVTITFVVYTIFLIAIAFLSGKSMSKISSKNYVDEFFTGGRKTGVLMLAFITAAGICSGGTFIGGPGMDNARGISYSLMNFFSFVFIGVNTIGTVGKKLGIIARRINADTYMDVFMARYNNNKIILSIGSFAIVIFLLCYCSSQFIGGARMLEVITGLDYKVAIILFAVVVIAYSTLGGIRGAGLASILQGTVMTIGALALGIGAVHYAGGMESIFRSLEAFDPTFVNPTTDSMWWMLSLWVMFGIIYLAMPHGALGCLTYKDTKTLHRAIFVACVCTPIWSISMNFSGLASVGIFGALDVADHTTPLMAATVLHPVLAGLTISGACAAAQSTIAAMLLAISVQSSKIFIRNYALLLLRILKKV